MKNSEQSAFGYGFANEQAHQEVTGLTKREYFAAMAMQGLMTKDYVKLHIDDTGNGESGYTNMSMVADMAVQIADKVLAELEKPNP